MEVIDDTTLGRNDKLRGFRLGHVTGEDLIHQAERSKERSEEAEICYVFNLRVQLQPLGFTVIGLPTLPTTFTLRSF